MLPIYWYCYRVGCAILTLEPIQQSWWQQLSAPPSGWLAAVNFYWTRFLDIAGPLWVGGIAVGFLAAYPTYYISYFVIRWYRMKRWGQLVPTK